jgi:predicted enzyme involved in methoxymalonyl-ACP biosynthesis
LQLQISEQLNIFEDRVTIITNSTQKLHHRKLAVDLLSLDQLEIMHNAATKIAHDEDSHNQAEKLSDFYQIEVTYSRTENDIVLMVHVPCIKMTSLVKIYRYLPSPIPIPFKLGLIILKLNYHSISGFSSLEMHL